MEFLSVFYKYFIINIVNMKSSSIIGEAFLIKNWQIVMSPGSVIHCLSNHIIEQVPTYRLCHNRKILSPEKSSFKTVDLQLGSSLIQKNVKPKRV